MYVNGCRYVFLEGGSGVVFQALVVGIRLRKVG